MRPLYVATAFDAARMVFSLLREDDSPFRLAEPAPEEKALVELLIRARVALVLDFLRVDEESASLEQADLLVLIAGYHVPLGEAERLSGQVRRVDGTPVPGPVAAPWKGRN